MTKTTLLPTAGKYEELESVRGIAALLVVFEHIPNWNSDFFDLSIIRNGYLMVELFFVLSGFVIYNAYVNNIKTGRDVLRFQFLRFGRLYPVHLLFLLIFVGLEFTKFFLSKYYDISSPNSIPFEINNVSTFTAHLFLVQALGVIDHVGSFNAPSWSISAEFYAYLLFALIILKLYKWRIGVFATLMILCYLMLRIPEAGRFSYFLICLIGFSAGCLVCEMVSRQRSQLAAYTPLIPLLALVLFLSQFPIGTSYPMIFLISAALIYSLVVSKDGFIKRVLRLKMFRSLGEISYSIYMSHFLILWIANQFIRVVLKYPETVINGNSYPHLSMMQAVVAYILVIAITLLASKLIFRFIEKPFREKSRIFAFRKMNG